MQRSAGRARHELLTGLNVRGPGFPRPSSLGKLSDQVTCRQGRSARGREEAGISIPEEGGFRRIACGYIAQHPCQQEVFQKIGLHHGIACLLQE